MSGVYSERTDMWILDIQRVRSLVAALTYLPGFWLLV